MGGDILVREANQPEITHYVDIGLRGIEREQLRSLPDPKCRSVHSGRLAPNVVYGSESIKQ